MIQREETAKNVNKVRFVYYLTDTSLLSQPSEEAIRAVHLFKRKRDSLKDIFVFTLLVKL